MDLAAPRGTERVAQALARMLAQTPGDAPRIQPLVPAAPPPRAVAVDGSHVILAESGKHLLAAFRAGSVGVEKGHPMPPQVPTPEVVLLTPENARDILVERLHADGFPAEGLPRLDPSGVLDALRTLDELRAATRALDRLDHGDLLMLDGALQSRPVAPLVDRVVAQAAERGVDVVGVCKSTSLTIGGAPALVACQLAARGGPARTWHAALVTPPNVRGASFAARLSPADERVFRFDVASGDPAVLARVAGLCGHPAYPGYPSPLAMAHNAVLLNDEARRRLRAQVQEAAIAAGVEPRAWENAFVDYHDILELGA